MYTTAPRLVAGGVPEDERNAVSQVSVDLGKLHGYVESFSAAVSLYDYSTSILRMDEEGEWPEFIRRWIFIAGRDGAMTLYHFISVIGRIRGESLRRSPTLQSLVEHEHLREADKLFRERFPELNKLRQSIAHAGELSMDKDAHHGPVETAGIRTAGGSMMITESFNNRTFTNTINGELVSYDLSRSTRDALGSILAKFYEGFRKAEVTLREAAQQAKPTEQS